jgi:chromosomal replication initiation ATPase DnaA
MKPNPPPNRDWLLVKQAPRQPVVLDGALALLGRVDTILHAVAASFATTAELIKGPRRDRELVKARFAAVALMLELCPELSLPQIGKLLGDRDHTTIIHARRRAGELLHPDKHSATWRAQYQLARTRLTSGP